MTQQQLARFIHQLLHEPCQHPEPCRADPSLAAALHLGQEDIIANLPMRRLSHLSNGAELYANYLYGRRCEQWDLRQAVAALQQNKELKK